jgi:hypothetical protein
MTETSDYPAIWLTMASHISVLVELWLLSACVNLLLCTYRCTNRRALNGCALKRCTSTCTLCTTSVSCVLLLYPANYLCYLNVNCCGILMDCRFHRGPTIPPLPRLYLPIGSLPFRAYRYFTQFLCLLYLSSTTASVDLGLSAYWWLSIWVPCGPRGRGWGFQPQLFAAHVWTIASNTDVFHCHSWLICLINMWIYVMYVQPDKCIVTRRRVVDRSLLWLRVPLWVHKVTII